MESYGPIRIVENMSKTFTLRSGELGITVYPGVMMRPEAKRFTSVGGAGIPAGQRSKVAAGAWDAVSQKVLEA